MFGISEIRQQQQLGGGSPPPRVWFVWTRAVRILKPRGTVKTWDEDNQAHMALNIFLYWTKVTSSKILFWASKISVVASVGIFKKTARKQLCFMDLGVISVLHFKSKKLLVVKWYDIGVWLLGTTGNMQWLLILYTMGGVILIAYPVKRFDNIYSHY